MSGFNLKRQNLLTLNHETQQLIFKLDKSVKGRIYSNELSAGVTF